MLFMETVSAASSALAAVRSATARMRVAVAPVDAAVCSSTELIPARDVAAVEITWAEAGTTVRVAAAGALR